jgi:hypothetical protein
MPSLPSNIFEFELYVVISFTEKPQEIVIMSTELIKNQKLRKNRQTCSPSHR